ncbi:MAG: class I SAM-dependent methyltransferase [Candidatus Omnitrophica bacterium]|nr:class I SAM-dependent methyltransferase [Candidatus Omnitrophota bacterium]
MAFAVTRGSGLLERFLAGQRHKVASYLLSAQNDKNRILDVGCGAYPLFLVNSNFREKYGLDKIAPQLSEDISGQKISIVNHDIEGGKPFPFESNYFNAVTMLAVIEHIEPRGLPRLFQEVYRVLAPGGTAVMTFPAAWMGKLLKAMARLRLVSSVEIGEHKNMLWPPRVISLLQEAGFAKGKARYGFFEIFMNSWVAVKK